MKKFKIIGLILISSISINAQTILYESDDFTDWTIYNPSQFGTETYNSGDLTLNGVDVDTIRIDIVKEFTNISGLDSIQVNFDVSGAGGADYFLDFYTSNDSINWNKVSITYDTPDIPSFITIYQSDLNTLGNSTYLRFQIRGYNYQLSAGMFIFSGHVFGLDISTYDNITNSVSEIESELNISVFDGEIVVESELSLSALEVFSIDGRLVYQNSQLNSSSASILIGEAGIYTVRLILDSGRAFVKKVYVRCN